MERNSLKLAGKLYLKTVLSSVLSLFVYLSVNAFMTIAATSGKSLSSGAAFCANLLALVLQGAIFITLVYSDLWSRGDRDHNAVQYQHITEDKLYGLKIGLLASVPSILSYVVLVADKLFGLWDPYATLYRLFQFSFYPVVAWSFGSQIVTSEQSLSTTAAISWVGMLTAAIPVLILPIISWVCYLLGYKQISLRERLIYDNRKKKQ